MRQTSAAGGGRMGAGPRLRWGGRRPRWVAGRRSRGASITHDAGRRVSAVMPVGASRLGTPPPRAAPGHVPPILMPQGTSMDRGPAGSASRPSPGRTFGCPDARPPAPAGRPPRSMPRGASDPSSNVLMPYGASDPSEILVVSCGDDVPSGPMPRRASRRRPARVRSRGSRSSPTPSRQPRIRDRRPSRHGLRAERDADAAQDGAVEVDETDPGARLGT